MEDFGYPPVFRETGDIDEAEMTKTDSDPVIKDKAKGKKVSKSFPVWFHWYKSVLAALACCYVVTSVFVSLCVSVVCLFVTAVHAVLSVWNEFWWNLDGTFVSSSSWPWPQLRLKLVTINLFNDCRNERLSSCCCLIESKLVSPEQLSSLYVYCTYRLLSCWL